jgi:hypothetical protein
MRKIVVKRARYQPARLGHFQTRTKRAKRSARLLTGAKEKPKRAERAFKVFPNARPLRKTREISASPSDTGQHRRRRDRRVAGPKALGARGDIFDLFWLIVCLGTNKRITETGPLGCATGDTISGKNGVAMNHLVTLGFVLLLAAVVVARLLASRMRMSSTRTVKQ